MKIPKKKPYITFLGAGTNKTKITWDDNAAKTGTTYTSATVSVMSDGFIAKGIAFEVTLLVMIIMNMVKSQDVLGN